MSGALVRQASIATEVRRRDDHHPRVFSGAAPLRVTIALMEKPDIAIEP
jgi:hypothetical protein